MNPEPPLNDPALVPLPSGGWMRSGAMERRRFLQLTGLGLGAALLSRVPALNAATTDTTATGADELERVFAQPPLEARTGVYWYWLGGAVTREGITADLEAMHAVGIGIAMMFSIGKSGKNPRVTPPADALTPQWWSMIEHAVSEAERLGMTLGLNICDGWATASGPWITPELSMQQLVWSETTIEGGSVFAGQLERPLTRENFYRDVAVLALPYPSEWDHTSETAQAKVTSSYDIKDIAKLTQAKNTEETLNTSAAGWIEFSFDTPFTLRSVTVTTPSPVGYSPGVYRAANSLEVQASDDGKTFRRIGALEYPRHGWQTDMRTLTHVVAQTTAKVFRLVHTPQGPFSYEEDYDFGEDTQLRLCSLVLSSQPRVHHLEVKNGQQWGGTRRITEQELPADACVPTEKIVDLTSKLGSDGRLDWQVPAGRWKILRIGHTTTGKKNSAAGRGEGLECDRFNAAAARAQFDGWFGEALRRVGPARAGRVLKYIHVDSWEAGTQNWGARFPEQFKERRGYSLGAQLAAMTGIPVENADSTERVLHDVRRTIAELTQENFYAPLAELAHSRGCLLSGEPPSPTYVVDGLRHIESLDLPMGEFWLNTPRNDKPTDIKDAVSGARIYGKRVIGAESFTQGLMHFDEHPFTLKPFGDQQFCAGINKFLLHVWAMQPWLDRAPGQTLNGIGTFFSRTQSWWKLGDAWFAYLHRCQALLQQGRAVVDFLYFIGEELPSRSLLRDRLKPSLPYGYAYDCVNRDVLLRDMRVENGEIVLTSGMRYRALVLPDRARFTLELLTRFLELTRAGARLVGARPIGLIGRELEPEAERRFAEICDELWGAAALQARESDGRREVGKGVCYSGTTLHPVLQDLGLGSDVATKALQGDDASLNWIHRAGDAWDLYFLANPEQKPVRVEATLRVAGRVPEFWRPDTGVIETVAEWSADQRTTRVPIELDPAGSVFIVFRRSAKTFDAVTQVDGAHRDALRLRVKENQVEAWAATRSTWQLDYASGKRAKLTCREGPEEVAVGGPWFVKFADRLPKPLEARWDRLSSWSEQEDGAIRFYSGSAVYESSVTLPTDAVAERTRWFLDLGRVEVIARVWLNEQVIGTLWKPPFEIEVTRAVRAGQNHLRIEVANTWRNRLIGDDQKPENERVTTVIPMRRKGQPWLPGAKDPLSPSGLLGPVRLYSAVKI